MPTDERKQPSNEPVKQRLDAAVDFARQAGSLTLEHFQSTELTVETKSDDSPVTVADRGAEHLLRERIGEAFPQDAIIGEEFGEQSGTSGYCWILDPIDGTKSFIHGVPLYGTLIGVQCDDQPSIGVILIPALDEMVFGAIGLGAWYAKGSLKTSLEESYAHQRGDAHKLEPIRCRVSSNTKLEDSLFLTSEIGTFVDRGAEEVFRHFDRRARLCRTWGDCYGYLLVATGRAELMIDPIMNLWDAAALLPVLVEAGGVYTDWQGRPTVAGGEGVGSNGHLHEQVIAVTSRYPRPSA